jgi:hypothetical protein
MEREDAADLNYDRHSENGERASCRDPRANACTCCGGVATVGPGSTTGLPRRPILSVEVVDFGPEVTEDAMAGIETGRIGW